MTMALTQRFTLDGSDALEGRLEEVCQQVRKGVGALVPASLLQGLLLAGGYGRGEGGVLRTPEGDQPYNDMEFYVLIRGNPLLVERRYGHSLHELGERLSPEAGLEVEFKVLTVEKLRRSPPSMFYYDLVLGHRWVVGQESLLAGCQHHRDASRIPLHEATRLLMNRCSGLLYSAERLARPAFGQEEADFVGRNLAKAQLAFGDALLTAHGQYDWSCRGRQERLLKLHPEEPMPWLDAVRQHHAEGVEFKLHPERSTEPRDALGIRHAELRDLGCRLWLWLESRRLGISFASARDYALNPINKCPETNPLRNRLINLRRFGARSMFNRRSWRYPRERLLTALSLLLWEPSSLTRPDLKELLREVLQTDAGDLSGLVAAYERFWILFN